MPSSDPAPVNQPFSQRYDHVTIFSSFCQGALCVSISEYTRSSLDSECSLLGSNCNAAGLLDAGRVRCCMELGKTLARSYMVSSSQKAKVDRAIQPQCLNQSGACQGEYV